MEHAFLKEESIFITKINEYFIDKKYYKITANREYIYNNVDLFKTSKVISQTLYSMFYIGYFEELVTFVSELYKRSDYEYEWLMYDLASLIALDDIYMAKSILKKAKIVSDENSKYLIEEDGANYSQIALIKDNVKATCLLLANYIYKFDDEGIDDPNIRVLKYYEIIDSIYSLGYNNELVNYLNDLGKLIFR